MNEGAFQSESKSLCRFETPCTARCRTGPQVSCANSNNTFVCSEFVLRKTGRPPATSGTTVGRSPNSREPITSSRNLEFEWMFSSRAYCKKPARTLNGRRKSTPKKSFSAPEPPRIWALVLALEKPTTKENRPTCRYAGRQKLISVGVGYWAVALSAGNGLFAAITGTLIVESMRASMPLFAGRSISLPLRATT
jgi:hypothetical protein